jgi:ribonucleotide monophosphatase NagD (HAD superfamily)
MGQEQAQIIRQIAGLSEISDRYDAILCDIWGVLHNGVASFAQASDALVSFRRRGGTVILISNAPRPSPPITRQVLKLGVSPDAFDAVVTSGDVTIGLMEQQAGDRVLHIGPARGRNSFPWKTPNMRYAPVSETTRLKHWMIMSLNCERWRSATWR